MGAFNLDGWCRAAATRVLDEYRIAPGFVFIIQIGSTRERVRAVRRSAVNGHASEIESALSGYLQFIK